MQCDLRLIRHVLTKLAPQTGHMVLLENVMTSPTTDGGKALAAVLERVVGGSGVHMHSTPRAVRGTGDGLGLGAAAFDHFDSPNIVIGETGYAGTIHVGNLTVSTGQLTLIADGTGGAINISEGLNLTDSKDGLSLYIRGSGATTDLNGTIQTAGAAYIEDAIRLIGDASIETTGGSHYHWWNRRHLQSGGKQFQPID